MGQLSPGFFFGVYCSVNNRLLFSYLDSIFSTFLVSFWAWAEREAIRGSLHLSSVGGAARTDSTHLEGGTVSSSSRRYPVPTEGNPNFPHDFDKEEGESGMGGIGSGRQWCWFTGNLTTDYLSIDVRRWKRDGAASAAAILRLPVGTPG